MVSAPPQTGQTYPRVGPASGFAVVVVTQCVCHELHTRPGISGIDDLSILDDLETQQRRSVVEHDQVQFVAGNGSAEPPQQQLEQLDMRRGVLGADQNSDIDVAFLARHVAGP